MDIRKRVVRVGIFLMLLGAIVFGKDAQGASGKARVLLVTRGEYNDSYNSLSPAPENDGENFRRVLEQAYGELLAETVVKRKEGADTVAGVQKVVYETFKDAEDGDINYFYYSGHGVQKGSGGAKESTLFLAKGQYMTAKDLAAAFEGVKGRNILVMDCCYSGGMVSRNVQEASASEGFAEDFVDAFQEAVSDSGTRARSALTSSGFQLLMAAGEEELCWQQKISESNETPEEEAVETGLFTATLSYGCGVNPARVGKETGYGLDTASADYNLDGEISLEEITRYIENTYHYTANHVRCYPANDSRSFLPVGEGLTPGAAFGNIVPAKDSAGNAIVKLFGHMKQGVLAEYAVYQGDTEDPDEATPYLSCYIYSEADYAEQGSEPVKILGKNMLMQVVPTDYQAIGHGNVLERGNCYRNFYWDGKNSAGQPVEEGMYYAVVNAAGAVEGSRRAAVYVKAPVPEETEPGAPSNPQEPSKSETEKMTETDQERPSEAPGTTETKKEETKQDTKPETVSIKIGKKAVKSITMGKKEKVLLIPAVRPQGSKVSYTSSNPRIASVDAQGKVKAKKVGRAVITVRTAKGTSANLSIRVKKAPTKIMFSARKKTLKAGESSRIKVRFPAKSGSYKIIFTSSRKKVAAVGADGKIRALKKGKTIITARSFNGKKARIAVTVK
ncbi:hypothetical protein E5357_08440 [Hominisplanchenecus murintestinalis]|uniref:Uncharacterized protein n=1 Tax=Hominisplanchenecus murintestinalis TaxID=2941517 RepID=A0AC61QYP5_9FIRM|nr:Ig-like domain-containing protein [Hominisplanchenecus murintestinalis]TGX98533.1 hypothetical protein E5357_08440 [Hominisplanchenecus murintestinalis]